jgi:two-component system sensor histidine kinase and response regulator WspE
MNAKGHDAPMDDSLDRMFLQEVETHCAAMSEGLLALEKNEAPKQTLENLMRAAHSIKGAARLVNRRSIERIAHALEDCFVLTQHGTITLGQADVSQLLRVVDFLACTGAAEGGQPEDVVAMQVAAHLAGLEKISLRAQEREPRAESGSASPASLQETGAGTILEVNTSSHSPALFQGEKVTGDEGGLATSARHGNREEVSVVAVSRDRFLRITAESLNRLLGLAGDSLVESRWMQSFIETMYNAARQQADAERALQSANAMLAQTPLPDQARAAMSELSRKLSHARDTLRRRIGDLDGHERRVSQVSHRLYMEVLRTRMRPFSDISQAFARLVRDLGVALGKEARLEITGESTQVDREVLASIETAITHLLRNAVDHGCEPSALRTRLGKPAECRIRLDARDTAGMLIVTVADDGAGVDPALLREAARKLRPRGFAQSATDNDLLDLLFVPGFTLKEKVTEISGRGVGLDVVYNTARKLRGNARIENEPGHGMKVILQLPLTLSVVRTLVVSIGGEPYAIPLANIERVARISTGQIILIQGKRHFRSGDDHVRLAEGRHVLGYPAAEQSSWKVLLLGERKARAALIVDDFIGERELMVQPLDARLGRVPGIAAAALLDDGQPVLVIEPEELIHGILTQEP